MPASSTCFQQHGVVFSRPSSSSPARRATTIVTPLTCITTPSSVAPPPSWPRSRSSRSSWYPAFARQVCGSAESRYGDLHPTYHERTTPFFPSISPVRLFTFLIAYKWVISPLACLRPVFRLSLRKRYGPRSACSPPISIAAGFRPPPSHVVMPRTRMIAAHLTA